MSALFLLSPLASLLSSPLSSLLSENELVFNHISPVKSWATRGKISTLPGAGLPLAAGLTLAAGAAFAIYDLVRIDDAVARVNKRLRVKVYLSQSAGAPQGFKGHYTDEQEPTGHAPGPTTNVERSSRAPSFAEQEKRLRELAAMRKKGGT